MNNFRVGEIVRDINPTWERINQIGTVVSVKGDRVTWISHTDRELVVDLYNDLEHVYEDDRVTSVVEDPIDSIKMVRRISSKCVGGYQIQDNRGNWTCPNMSSVTRRRNERKDVSR